MSQSQLKQSLDALKRCIGSQHPNEAKTNVEGILSYFEGDLTGPELGLF